MWYDYLPLTVKKLGQPVKTALQVYNLIYYIEVHTFFVYWLIYNCSRVQFISIFGQPLINPVECTVTFLF